jgi:hypothetical protein
MAYTYTLIIIIEKQAMHQDVVVDAAALKSGLAQDGRLQRHRRRPSSQSPR